MTFKLSIVNPEKVLWSGEAESLIAPGEEGELTVLSNHEALITPLVKGVLKLKSVHWRPSFCVRMRNAANGSGVLPL